MKGQILFKGEIITKMQKSPEPLSQNRSYSHESFKAFTGSVYVH
jgi:hypothetical protein